MIYVKIPLNRVAVLIGEKGKVKRYLEDRTGLKLKINSKSGDVRVVETENCDPAMILKLRDIVRAIGRGFAPQKAYQLLDEDAVLAVFDIRDFTGKRSKDVRRIRSRVIGSDGKTRRLIETIGEVSMVVQGNSVALIGNYETIDAGSRAVELLLSGSEHSTIYQFLERKKRGRKINQLGSFEYIHR